MRSSYKKRTDQKQKTNIHCILNLNITSKKKADKKNKSKISTLEPPILTLELGQMREIRESSADLFKFGKTSLPHKEGLLSASLRRSTHKLALTNALSTLPVFSGIL